MRTTARRTNYAASAAAASLLLALCLWCPAGARAQWTPPDANQNISTVNAGNVGVGTTGAPQAKLEVEGSGLAVRAAFGGNTVVQGVGPHGKFQLYSRNLPNNPFAEMQMYSPQANGDEYLRFNIGNSSGNVYADVLTINRVGRVGVGTASPESLFHVVNPSGLGDLRLSGWGAAMTFVDTQAAADQRRYQWRSGGGLFRMSLVNDTDGGFVRQDILTANASGQVGVGTASPGANLDVSGAGVAVRATVTGGAGANGKFQLYYAGGGAYDPFAEMQLYAPQGAGSEYLRFNVRDAAGVHRVDALTISNAGGVGVGTAAPAAGYKLDVAGAANVGGNLNVTGNITGGTITATFQDVAEWVPSVQKLSAGTVVVLDAGRTNHVLASTAAYDTKVAGVVSAQPGVILGVAGEGKVKVATTGRVKVKVDASRGAIKVGDLLVTSDAEGVAMKSIPVDLGGAQIHRPGTIIGKALEPLESGKGEILVLLSLQ